MILDAYTTTRSTDSIEIRIIAENESVLEIDINSSLLQVKPKYIFNNKQFYNIKFLSLKSNTEYSIAIRGSSENIIRTSTLNPPAGKKLFCFALFGDPHVIGEDTGNDLPVEHGPRLYSKASFLLQKYSQSAENLGAAFIALLGDIADPATEKNMKIIKKIINHSPIPWYPVIGNHEAYCSGGEQRFYKEFNMSPEGYYSKIIEDNFFIFLSTPSQSSLLSNGNQYKWLIQNIQDHPKKKLFLFSHFASLLHPCVKGYKNDGMQELCNSEEILVLLRNYSQVKAWFAGHKNIPSVVIKNNIAHFLTPQFIQAPCGFDIVEVYEKGLIRMYHEIDEQHFVWIARVQGKDSWEERYGTENDRNVVINY